MTDEIIIIENKLEFIRKDNFWYARNNNRKREIKITNNNIVKILDEISEEKKFMTRNQIIELILVNYINIGEEILVNYINIGE
jgi:hypothetical protein